MTPDDPIHLITPRILHDGPLQDAGDTVNFNFDEYASTLARLIAGKKTKTPFTLGVSGAWGTGKTTLLRRIRLKLDETAILLEQTKPSRLSFLNSDELPSDYRVCRTVWFNAWKYAGEDQLLVALIRVIVQSMAQDSLVMKMVGKLLDPSYPRRDVVGTVLSWFSIDTGFMKVGLNTGDPQPTPFAEKIALLDLFDDAFDRLTAAWVHQKLNVEKIDPGRGIVVVFIDDLDRCLPPKMIQVLEAVKLFMDKRGCVFVLGADSAIIQQAVEKQYEGAKVNKQAAGDYLEKVIQLRFNLPPIPDDSMNDFVCSQVTDTVLQQHWRIVTLGAESNPRKVKTFLNDLQLQWAVWQNTRQEQGIDFDDFVRWEVLMRTAPGLRTRMYTQIYDPETRADVLKRAFAWSAGDDEAAQQLGTDLNEQSRRILIEIQPCKEHFTSKVITSLIFLSASVQVVGKKIPEVIPGEELIKKGEVPAGLRTGEEGVPLRTPGGHEVFMFGGIEFVKIPAGEFFMGSTVENKLASENEQPQFKLNIPYDYWIGRFPVTNAGYATFAGKDFVIPANEEGHPVEKVTWNDAQEYIARLNEEHSTDLPPGYAFRLPSEAEWEKAARGELGSEYPWGSQFDPTRCNAEGGKGGTTPVGAYSPAGDSPYGCSDMAGNVWEWTRSLYRPYPYNPGDGREDLSASRDHSRGLRGGSFNSYVGFVRCAYRSRSIPNVRGNLTGFRVVVSPPSTSDL